jgi:GT2 family glycosyltransferase
VTESASPGTTHPGIQLDDPEADRYVDPNVDPDVDRESGRDDAVGFRFLDDPAGDGDYEAPFERRAHYVTTVIVSHDGAVWLPAVVTTLAQQMRPTNAVVGVDNASSDASAQILEETLGADRVVRRTTNDGFGAAVAAGLDLARASAPQIDDHIVEWVWLLHDDSAPDPGCLDALLIAADKQPSADVLGPKVLGWHDQRLLLEVGVTVNADGRRVTGLERREHDQGQHDGDRDVLAVSSAGMLIRRDVWDRLGGFDPNLPLFRDDLDLCWRVHRAGGRVLVATDAVIHHREASAHGRRQMDLRPHRADREAAVRVLVAQAPAALAPLVALRLFAGSFIRSIGYLIGKDLRAAREEIGAVLAVAAHPARLSASRRSISRTSLVSAGSTRALRPSTVDQIRGVGEAIAGLLTTSSAATAPTVSALDSGPIDDDAAYLPEDSSRFIRRILLKPSVMLTLLLVLVAVISTRSLWWGEGVLQGGALLPVPPGASDVWSSYIRAWHDVGPGSTTPAAPYLIVVATLATALFGNADWAMNVIVLLAVPLAGWSAYFAARGMVRSKVIRMWMGATYALLPAMTGAVEQGRIGTLISAVVLPFAIRSGVRLSRRTGTTRRAGGTALLMSIVLAATPAMWLVGVVVAIGASVLAWRRLGSQAWGIVLRFAIAMLVPLLTLMPWTLHLIAHPSLFLLEPGLDIPAIVDPNLRPLDVLLLHPGGPGMNPLWVTGPLVFASLLALLRRDTLPIVGSWWVLGLLALVVGVGQSLVLITPPGALVAVRPWPGPMTLMLGLAMIAASAVAVEGLRERFAAQDFTLGQPLAAVAAIGALIVPVVSAAWWIPATDDVVVRAPRTDVPAFVAAEADGPQAPRTLVLSDNGEGVVRYTLLGGAALGLGDAETAPPAQVWKPIDEFVAALASGRGGGEVDALRTYGVRYIKLAAGSSRSVVPALDAQPGLRRLASAEGEVLWRIGGVTSRAQVWDVDTATGEFVPIALDLAVDPAKPGEVGVDPYLRQSLPEAVDLPPGSRVLWVGATADRGWRAASNGQRLAPATLAAPRDWSSSFVVPVDRATSEVEIVFDDAPRRLWLLFQLIVIVALIIVALPERRVIDPDPDDVDTSERAVDVGGRS